MRKFLIFVALCAICNGSPLNNLDNASPRVLKRVSREEKPHSVVAHEGLQHNSDHAKHNAEALLEIAGKPDSVKAHEALQHSTDHAKTNAETLIAHAALPHDAPAHDHHDNKHSKRDIPVPTEIKTTAAPKEDAHKESALVDHIPPVEHEGSTTPHGPLRHRPVPVAELFNKPKPGGSSEESKESDESKEGSKP